MPDTLGVAQRVVQGKVEVPNGLTHDIAYVSNTSSFTFSGGANLNNSIPRFFEIIP